MAYNSCKPFILIIINIMFTNFILFIVYER